MDTALTALLSCVNGYMLLIITRSSCSCSCRAAKKVVEDIAKEQIIAARISGVPPSMHVILTPNTDGDEATLTTADIIAGRAYVHKVDAVLVPKSMLKYLESFTNKKKKSKKGNATVTEALKGANATANGTESRNSTKAANRAAEALAATSLKANKTYLNGSSLDNATKNATLPSKAAKSAGDVADVAFTVLVGMPLMLASFLLAL